MSYGGCQSVSQLIDRSVNQSIVYYTLIKSIQGSADLLDNEFVTK